MIRPGKHLSSTTSIPKCMVCTTPARCGAPALHTKGPRCIGRADGKDDCDCLNTCGDDPWLATGQSTPCEHRRETKARIAALAQATPPAPSPTAGMNIAQRILHVGGRNNAAGYVEFGSIQAVEALVRQVLRDLPAPQQEAQEPVAWQSRTRPTWEGNTSPWSPWKPCTKEQAEDCWKTPLLHEWAYEARALYTAPQPSPAAQGDALDAARYRFLRDGEWRDTDLEPFIRLQLNTLWDAKIDAARAAQEGK